MSKVSERMQALVKKTIEADTVNRSKLEEELHKRIWEAATTAAEEGKFSCELKLDFKTHTTCYRLANLQGFRVEKDKTDRSPHINYDIHLKWDVTCMSSRVAALARRTTEVVKNLEKEAAQHIWECADKAGDKGEFCARFYELATHVRPIYAQVALREGFTVIPISSYVEISWEPTKVDT